MGASALASTAYADDACEGIDTAVSETRQQEYATLIAQAISEDLEPSESLLPTDVTIYNILESGHWSAIYGSIPTADIAIFYFEDVAGRKEFRDVRGDWPPNSENSVLIKWGENLGAPENLATCLANLVVDGAGAEQPTDGSR